MKRRNSICREFNQSAKYSLHPSSPRAHKGTFPQHTAFIPVPFPPMAWLMLILAGCLEVVWAVGLKYTEGFTRLWPSVWTLLSMGTSFVLLSQAMKQLPLGTAYAVWVGIGTIG